MKKENKKQNKKNVVITGASGHLGSFLLKAISPNRKFNIFTPDVDITNEKKLAKYAKIFQKADVLAHLAAYVPQDRKLDDLDKSISVNVRGSLNLVNLLRKGSKVVFANTAEIYFPRTFYAISKLAAEKNLEIICRKKGITLISLRFASIFGPGEKIHRAIPNFIKAAIGDKDIVIFGDGQEKRSYLYVEDAAQAVIRAISFGQSGIFDVSSGEVISILELAKLIKKIAGSKSKIIFKQRVKEKKDLAFSVKEAKSKLGFRPKFTLSQGLREEIKYFKEHAQASHLS